MKIIWVVGLLVGIIGLAACSGGGAGMTPSMPAANSAAQAPASSTNQSATPVPMMMTDPMMGM
ncbi:MAG TPA: hypothetical protein VGI15_08930 [Candidatus Cybelea sp.]